LDLFNGLSPPQIKLLERAATAMSYKTGDVIIREGDSARLFFVIARGSVSVRLRGVSAEGRLTTRVASIGQGMPFGEMALFGGGKRSADIVAEEPVICYGFSVDELRDLGRDDPDLLATILANITFDLTERLRRANEQIRALEF
jgi:glutaminase